MLNHDKFTFAKRGVFISQSYLDLTQETTCNGFLVEGAQPLGTDRRFAFRVDDNYFVIKNSAPALFDHELNADNLLKYGSTAAELLSVNNLSGWLGKKIFPVIALYNDSSPVEPTAKVGLKVYSFNTIFNKTTYSPIFKIPQSKIISIAADKITTGNATLNLRVRLKQNNSWTNWLEFSEAKNQFADAVQLSAEHIVTRLDSRDAAQVKNISINYLRGTAGNTYICTKTLELPDRLLKALDQPIFDDDVYITRDEIKSVIRKTYQPAWEEDGVRRTDIDMVMRDGVMDFSDLKALTSFVLVDHSLLKDTKLFAYICSYNAPEHQHLNLGTSDGTLQSFIIDTHADISTLQVQADGENVIPFACDMATGLLQVKAALGQILTADFDLTPTENWQEMQVQFQEDFRTCFIYQSTAPEKFMRVIVIAYRQEGIVQQNLSAGVHVLDHKTFPEKISCTSGYLLDDKIFTCKDDCTLDYAWQGEPVNISCVKCAFV